METILLDLKRIMRSILDPAHAHSDVQMYSGRQADSYSTPALHRYIKTGSSIDVYGRKGQTDIYSGREAFEFYKKMSCNKMPPL